MNSSREKNSASGNVSGEGGVALAKDDAQASAQGAAQPPQGVSVQSPSQPAAQKQREAALAVDASPDVASGMGDAARNWAVVAHLSGLSLYLGIPFGNILGPLVVWLIKKGESPYAEAQAKEALNFQISLTLYGIAAGLLTVLLIGLFLLPILFVLHVVLTIVATIRASEGRAYRYPLTIRLIS